MCFADFPDVFINSSIYWLMYCNSLESIFMLTPPTASTISTGIKSPVFMLVIPYGAKYPISHVVTP